MADQCSCGAHRGLAPGHPFKVVEPEWRTSPNGDRTCSYCGSWHPDEFLAFLKQLDGINTYTDLADRRHKVYVHRDGVSNAGEGAIKFYVWHVPTDRRAEFEAAINASLDLSGRHARTRMKALFGQGDGDA